MPCAVAVAKSPVFIPSPRASPIFCKPTTSLSPSPSSPCSSPSSLSPLTIRLHKQQQQQQPSNFFKREEPICSTSSRSNTATTLMKRKRPLRLDVPLTALSFEAMVQTARETERLDDDVEVDGERYGVYCKRGKRGVMEDRFSAIVGLQGDSKQAFFGVFDGHGGAKAAEYAAKNMDRYIMNEVEKNPSEGRIEEAVKEGYLTTDAEFLKEETDGGTCSVTALIRQGNLVVSNAGDCRAVMSRGGVAEALTVDHRPSREDERERVESMGGYVDWCRGGWRIQGSLAVSRGIGDRHLKQWVIAEPETKILRIGEECEFLILASDGLWDKVSNQEAVDIVRPFCIGADNPDALSACKSLVDLSLRRGSSDDISVVVVQLGRFIQ